MDRIALGWRPEDALAFAPYAERGWVPGRVGVEHRKQYEVYGPHGTVLAEVSGAFRNGVKSRPDFPAVGDWVALTPHAAGDRAFIQALLPRRTCFLRRAAGREVDAQVLGANVDVVFLMTSLNRDFNVRRLERYLALAWESGAEPVVLLTKLDLCEDLPACLDAVAEVAAGVPVHAISALLGDGVEQVAGYLSGNRTIALLGSSGVGKSTLLNRLLGEGRMEVSEIRDKDDRGRHTTTRRELVPVATGGLVLDTPGLREVQLWGSTEGLEGAFAEIAAFAQECRFKDCGHGEEPGCAVTAALERGELSPERFESYQQLRAELAYTESRFDPERRAERKRYEKEIHRAQKAAKALKGR